MEKHAYFGFYVIGCTNFKCLTKSSVYKEKAEAIKAWNARQERTCKNISRYGENFGYSTVKGDFAFKCSACFYELSCDEMGNSPLYDPDEHVPINYCPGCGAKVVD